MNQWRKRRIKEATRRKTSMKRREETVASDAFCSWMLPCLGDLV
jgi:hypothetical protein